MNYEQNMELVRVESKSQKQNCKPEMAAHIGRHGSLIKIANPFWSPPGTSFIFFYRYIIPTG